MRAIPGDNLTYPVFVQTDQGSGSGFYFSSETNHIYFVTAKHVLFDQNQNLLSPTAKLMSYTTDLKCSDRLIVSLELQKLLDEKVLIAHDSVDVLIIRIANLTQVTIDGKQKKRIEFINGVKREDTLQNVHIAGLPQAYFKTYEETLIGNEVMIFGYPNSLGFPGQIDYSRPLLRKGIIAGKNDKNRTVILDCPVYYGNSGGLAIEIEEMDFTQTEFRAIGIVSQYIPFIEQLLSLQHKNINNNIENSGYSVVVPIDTILELIG